jgi:Bacteroidetes VLRF1 release factor
MDSNSAFRRPLYIFDLPRELLASLTLATATGSHAVVSDHAADQPILEPSSEHHGNGHRSMSCNLCRVSFKTVEDQRQHSRSDFHRYNLKLNVKQLPAIDEATFIRMIGELDESISGSESSDSDGDDASRDDPLSVLMKKQAKLTTQDLQDTQDNVQKRVSSNAPLIWMSSPKLENNSLLGVYKALFSAEEYQEATKSLTDLLLKKQLAPVAAKQRTKNQNATSKPNASSDPHYFLCMIGGGHFAAMIVSLIPEIRRGAGGIEERHPIVLAHKTFHRYTTRRKQGGSQSANDNAKGNAHSAGSSIRRANEAALELDIRAVLTEWRPIIDSAELIFVRATGSTNRRTLFGPYDGQVLSTKDTRLRSFPFSTRRATQAELLRGFQELTRLKLSMITEIETTKPQPDTQSTTTKTQKPKPPEPPKFTPSEQAAQLHTSQLVTLIRRSKAPALLLYLTKNNLSANEPFFPPSEHHHAPRPLHLASSLSQPALISALLLKAHADPTLLNPDGKPAYDLAGDQRTRDAFRVARHTLGEEKFDWPKSHVGSALTQEEADARHQTEKATEQEEEIQRRKDDLARIEREEEARESGKWEKKAGQGQSLSSAVPVKSGAEKRERRARAAEERMRRMQGQ